MTYSNNALKSVSELLINFKSLEYFRDYLVIPNFLLPVRRGELITPELAEQARESEARRTRVTQAVQDYKDLGKNHYMRKKAHAANEEIVKCRINVNVSGDRLYISLFDD